jgi:hypothetical protein
MQLTTWAQSSPVSPAVASLLCLRVAYYSYEYNPYLPVRNYGVILVLVLLVMLNDELSQRRDGSYKASNCEYQTHAVLMMLAKVKTNYSVEAAAKFLYGCGHAELARSVFARYSLLAHLHTHTRLSGGGDELQ